MEKTYEAKLKVVEHESKEGKIWRSYEVIITDLITLGLKPTWTERETLEKILDAVDKGKL